MEMFTATSLDVTVPPDKRVRELSVGDVASAQARTSSWIFELLHGRLTRGWQAFGIFSDEALVAHVCCGFPTDRAEEIFDLFTSPSYRGRGFAAAVVSAAARAVLARGRQPIYCSRSANEASQRVALRCGFTRVASFQEVTVGG
jgi:predicted GNAT family acetyltransferase